MTGVKKVTYPDPISIGFQVRDDGNVWITLDGASVCFIASHDSDGFDPGDAWIDLEQGGAVERIAEIEFEGQGWLDWWINDYPPPNWNWKECGGQESFSDKVVGEIEGRSWNPSGITPGTAEIVGKSQGFNSRELFRETVQVSGTLPTKDRIRVTDVTVSESNFTVTGSFAVDNPVPFGYDVTVRITADDERNGQRILTREVSLSKSGSVEAGRGNVEQYDIEPFDVPPGTDLRVCAEVINVA